MLVKCERCVTNDPRRPGRASMCFFLHKTFSFACAYAPSVLIASRLMCVCCDSGATWDSKILLAEWKKWKKSFNFLLHIEKNRLNVPNIFDSLPLCWWAFLRSSMSVEWSWVNFRELRCSKSRFAEFPLSVNVDLEIWSFVDVIFRTLRLPEVNYLTHGSSVNDVILVLAFFLPPALPQGCTTQV